MFVDKVLLITGGTGSFGNAVLRKFLGSGLREIRIFSRDEKKQDDMRRKYSDSRIKFYIGDVRNYDSVCNAVIGVDYLFHAAALKQVPSCEFHPIEATLTNVIGTENVLKAAIQYSVQRVVCLSTDKAVYPVNAMGMSKGLMEKVLVARSRQGGKNVLICGTRYGNVMASRGSVIPLFIEQVSKSKDISITDPDMTRFMMTIDDAVDLVLYAFHNGNSGDIFVQKSPAATIGVLAEAIRELMGKPKYPVKIIGTRHGEKQFETLMSREESAAAEDLGRYYRIPADNRSLNYQAFTEEGKSKITAASDYNSHNTNRLDVSGMKQLLLKLDCVRGLLPGNSSVAELDEIIEA